MFQGGDPNDYQQFIRFHDIRRNGIFSERGNQKAGEEQKHKRCAPNYQSTGGVKGVKSGADILGTSKQEAKGPKQNIFENKGQRQQPASQQQNQVHDMSAKVEKDEHSNDISQFVQMGVHNLSCVNPDQIHDDIHLCLDDTKFSLENQNLLCGHINSRQELVKSCQSQKRNSTSRHHPRNNSKKRHLPKQSKSKSQRNNYLLQVNSSSKHNSVQNRTGLYPPQTAILQQAKIIKKEGEPGEMVYTGQGAGIQLNYKSM